MRRILLLALALLLPLMGCASSKYPGWDRVVVEMSGVQPSHGCVFRIQETCTAIESVRFSYDEESEHYLQHRSINSCLDGWFQKRATLFAANYVVISDELMIRGPDSCKRTAPEYVPDIRCDGARHTYIADYYHCPSVPTTPPSGD